MPAGPEILMKMEEYFLHLVELRLAACELHHTTTRHELKVCSLRSRSQRMSNSVCGEAPMPGDGVVPVCCVPSFAGEVQGG
jgi:hypothetical protein